MLVYTCVRIISACYASLLCTYLHNILDMYIVKTVCFLDILSSLVQNEVWFGMYM